jgi:hypothetical protein
MKSSDSRRDNATGAEFSSCGNTTLGKPGLVPIDLSIHVKVCRVILILVCECVREMSKCVKIT